MFPRCVCASMYLSVLRPSRRSNRWISQLGRVITSRQSPGPAQREIRRGRAADCAELINLGHQCEVSLISLCWYVAGLGRRSHQMIIIIMTTIKSLRWTESAKWLCGTIRNIDGIGAALSQGIYPSYVHAKNYVLTLWKSNLSLDLKTFWSGLVKLVRRLRWMRD